MSANGREITPPAVSRGESGKWLPGSGSANPGGRPKGYGEIRRLARGHSKRAIARLAELVESDDGRVAIAACVVLLDRGFGRPKERDLTEEQLERELDRRLAALAARAQALVLTGEITVT
jgi:hypothetical protein